MRPRIAFGAMLGVALLTSCQQSDGKKLAVEFYNRANDERANGRLDEAIANYTKAIESDPKLAEAYFNRGGAYHDKGWYDQAVADFTEVIQLDPNDADAFSNRGRAQVKRGRLDVAIPDFSKSIELNPRDPANFAVRGSAYMTEILDEVDRLGGVEKKWVMDSMKGRIDEAIADFNKTIELDPTYVNAFLMRGMAYRLNRQYDDAVADFTKTIELDPKDVTVFYLRGEAYVHNCL